MMHDLDRVVVFLSSYSDFLSDVSTLLSIAQDYLDSDEPPSQLKIKLLVDEAQSRLEALIDDLGYCHRLMVVALIMFGAAATREADRTQQQISEVSNG
jgi:hypothetical protein